jgi:threonine dehydrogenase-like Zn-dependent dehydrogenase
MRVVVMHALGDFRVQEREEPEILKPTDAIIRVSATCECGSDRWPYRGAEPIDVPSQIGHEYMGFVEEVGIGVTTVTPGRFVVGAFSTSDNTSVNCRAGYQTSCVQREWVNARGAQAERLRIPLADGTLVATPGMPDEDLIPSLLTASDTWAPDGSRPRPPGPDRARRSPLSVTERSGCWVCSRPSNSVPSASPP